MLNNFLRPGLGLISRTTFDWGVPYRLTKTCLWWIDALSNITALDTFGYDSAYRKHCRRMST